MGEVEEGRLKTEEFSSGCVELRGLVGHHAEVGYCIFL